MTEYLSCAATAKLVRKALKDAFPGTKFSVRSETYSMGAAIRVSYGPGPGVDQVKAVTDQFRGAAFDSMNDCMTYKTHVLDGREVQFGADFITVER